jgi:hypothetical protein
MRKLLGRKVRLYLGILYYVSMRRSREKKWVRFMLLYTTLGASAAGEGWCNVKSAGSAYITSTT